MSSKLVYGSLARLSPLSKLPTYMHLKSVRRTLELLRQYVELSMKREIDIGQFLAINYGGKPNKWLWSFVVEKL